MREITNTEINLLVTAYILGANKRRIVRWLHKMNPITFQIRNFLRSLNWSLQ